jgi:hypothetical protein
MKILLRIILSIAGVVALLVLIAFADGATLPVDHSVSVSGTVNAPPPAVFARITDIANAAAWRPQVKSVKVLPKDNSRDAWIEDDGLSGTMQFLAITTAPPGPSGHGVRQVKTDAPSYGGTWTYDLTPGPTPNTTTLKITEDGYINPPIYRFVMAHIMGPTKNLDDYLKDIQQAFAK